MALADQKNGKRILITGASIAGNTLAWWLSRRGFRVTVVERHPEFRDGGQNIDVRGTARDVLRKMDLEDKIAANGTGEKGIRFVDENDNAIAEFPVSETGSDGPTAELEILRGDLARLLYEASKGAVDFRFGDQIAAVEDTPAAAIVSFKSGVKEDYDLVVIAEGAGSATREMVFPGENEPRNLDVTMGYFTIPKGADDDEFCRIFTAGEGRSIWLRPDNEGTTRVILTLQKPPSREDDLSVTERKAFLRERFQDAGWQAKRVLSGLESTDDFYFDVLRQVKMARWSKGRVVLTGDAAWCATPISGVGTTLAIVGSYVLAGEIATNANLEEALDRYDEIMRPFADKGQDVPKSAPKFLQPQTRFGVALQHVVLRIAGTGPVKAALAKIMASKAETFELPEYDDIATGGLLGQQ